MAAGELGFSERMASGVASQVIARLLIETGRGLDELTEADLTDLALACQQRQERTGRGWRHYRGAAPVSGATGCIGSECSRTIRGTHSPSPSGSARAPLADGRSGRPAAWRGAPTSQHRVDV